MQTDEPIFGYANRAFVLSGYANRNVFYRRLLGDRNSGATSMQVECGLSKFQDSMQRFGIRFDRTMPEEHCIGAIGLPFCSDAAFEEKVSATTEHVNVGQCLSFGMSMTKIKTSPSFCPACAADDLEYFGFSHWRRAPQVVGVNCCTVHSTALCDQCPSCHAPWSTFDFPSTNCPSCDLRLLPKEHSTTEVFGAVQYRFAEAVEGVFAGRITGPMTSQCIRSRIFDVLPGPNRVLGDALSRLFMETARPAYLKELGLHFSESDMMPWPTYLYCKRAIIAEATVQLLTYAVLSHDKPREEMFCDSFPNGDDWRVVDKPSSLVELDWCGGFSTEEVIGYRPKNPFR